MGHREHRSLQLLTYISFDKTTVGRFSTVPYEITKVSLSFKTPCLKSSLFLLAYSVYKTFSFVLSLHRFQSLCFLLCADRRIQIYSNSIYTTVCFGMLSLTFPLSAMVESVILYSPLKLSSIIVTYAFISDSSAFMRTSTSLSSQL